MNTAEVLAEMSSVEASTRMEEFATTLGRQVRLHRYLRGWGPSELARRARISRTALFRLEHGTTVLPRAVTIQRIAQAFEVTVDELLCAPAEPGPSDVPPTPDAPEPESPPLEARPNLDAVLDKFLDLLRSPLGRWVARLVEETHRYLREAEPRAPRTPPA